MDTRSQSAANSELDWLAGIIDGEGSVMLVRRQYKNDFTFKPTISIANTHEPTIQRASEIFKSHGLGTWICTGRDKRGKYPAQYTLFCCGFKRMTTFLDLMQTRLFTKRKQADLLREFVVSRGGIGGHPGKKYTERERQIAQEIAECNRSRYVSGGSETTRIPAEAEDIVQA